MRDESIFRDRGGRSYLGLFGLVGSLFLLWGFCNGMIDVMDKHFQNELHLTLSQSAWVQFAHYLGYFLMALPAGTLASRLGYKGGIVTGLLLVALGGLWFIPATRIASFWAFLVGVCLIAAGLTFLETVANPYATLLGPKRYASTRINLGQACNGVGWILGPIAGGLFFYSTDASGRSTGAETLWIPYAGVAAVVLVLLAVFARARVPDLAPGDDYHLDDARPEAAPSPASGNHGRRLALFLLWLNVAALAAALGMIGAAVLSIFRSDSGLAGPFFAVALPLLAAGTAALLAGRDRLTHHSVWMHPHFSASTLAQFLYVAAQAGIFGFFINYLTGPAVPPIPPEAARIAPGLLSGWFAPLPEGGLRLTDKAASELASLAFACFLAGRVAGALLMKRAAPDRVLGWFGLLNAAACLLVAIPCGWLSAGCLFLSYFLMSVMFPTIFALGIAGLGARSKRAAGFLVMAIMGGAIVPKLMGHIADVRGISLSFVVPLGCFAAVAAYGFAWRRLSGLRPPDRPLH